MGITGTGRPGEWALPGPGDRENGHYRDREIPENGQYRENADPKHHHYRDPEAIY